MFKRIFAATIAVLAAGAVAFAVTVTGQFTQTQNQVVKGAYFRMSTHVGLTALVGGAQAGTALDAGYNVVTTVASGNDSVQLPECKTQAENLGGLGSTDGILVIVTNAAAANSMNLYPQTDDAINALGANAAYAVAANKTVAFVCNGTTETWYSILGG